MKCIGFVILCVYICHVKSENVNDNKLTNLWQLGSEANSRTPNVERSNNVVGNIVNFVRRARIASGNTWVPQSKPVASSTEPQTQMERTVRYRRNEHPVNRGKTEILFPGNYFPIADVKTKKNDTDFNQFDNSDKNFIPKAIPLLRNREGYGRSEVEEVHLGVQPGSYQPNDMRRSISYFDSGEDDEGGDYEEAEEDLEDEDGLSKKKSKKHKKVKKFFKHAKYMLPLLLAYKLKFFTLIPLLKGLLVLLTGSTGLAGFFFALFAAVIGLKTGNW